MKKRPAIRVGDVVRLSKKYRADPKHFPTTMTAVKVGHGDSADGRTAITVMLNNKYGKVQCMTFRRRQLWNTGYNIIEAGKSVSVKGATLGNASVKHPVASPVAIVKPVENICATPVMSANKPVTQEDQSTQCRCGKMANRFKICYYCGAQN
jgi:hypothetical protein